MREAKTPKNEEERLAKLHEYDILDSLPEGAYEDIVRLAAHICEVPIALISLVDRERQWFKARYGLEAAETSREVSFCAHVVESSHALFVSDALEDERFVDNPLVVGGPKIRFYAGVPLRDEEVVLGTLCVIDREPRELSPTKREMLEALSRQVMAQLALRLELNRSEQLRAAQLEAEHELRRIKGIHKRFFSLSLELLCVAGFDGCFKELNPAWTTTLGFEEEELLARPFLEFVHPDDREATIAETQKLAARKGDTVGFDNRYRTRSGEWRWLSWSATWDPEEELILAAARDVTEQKQREEELREACQRAEQADRAKSQFLATMSHELRTPLNAIIGFSNILLKNKKGHLRAPELKYTGRIRENGIHLLALINEILDLSKIEAGQMTYQRESCHASNLVDVVVRLQEAMAQEKGLSLEVLLPPREAEPFYADEHRIRQILLNLLSNAIKFTSEGGITLRISLHEQTPYIAAIEVCDTGVGIAAEHLEKVFLPFEQVDGKASRSYAGTGLGLAICRSLAEGMGMSLEVDSSPGEGSTFRLLVPRVLSHPPRSSGPPSASSLPASPKVVRRPRRPRVLVTDDNDDAREYLSHVFEELGCEVRLARDGSECLEIGQAWRPDLITLDLMMPKTNGWQALARMQELEAFSGIPVAVISMFAEEVRDALFGVAEIIGKPARREELASFLQRALGHHRRALVIEDDPDARFLLSRCLQQAGWEIATSTNGKEALLALETFEPTLIFLDLMMPEMGGVEFLEHLRAREAYEALPVVVVTSKELDAKERRVLLEKADLVLQKGQDLTSQLGGVLAGLRLGAG